jgi:hypothetical protein
MGYAIDQVWLNAGALCVTNIDSGSNGINAPVCVYVCVCVCSGEAAGGVCWVPEAGQPARPGL